jgi:hypothetical protein
MLICIGTPTFLPGEQGHYDGLTHESIFNHPTNICKDRFGMNYNLFLYCMWKKVILMLY